MSGLPSVWTENCPRHLDLQKSYEDSLEANGLEATENVKQGICDFNSVWLVGSKDGSVHVGLECCGLPCLRLCDPWAHWVAGR